MLTKLKRTLSLLMAVALVFGLLAPGMTVSAAENEEDVVQSANTETKQTTVVPTEGTDQTLPTPTETSPEAVPGEGAFVSNKETEPTESASQGTEATGEETNPTEAADAVLGEEESLEPLSVAETDVAKIGDTGYATLEAAITAAQDGDTIELLKDVTLSGSTTISKSITIQPAEGLSVTIHRGAFQPAMFKVTKATLTLSGSLTLDGAKSDGSASYGSIVLCENGTSASPSALVMNEGVTLCNNEHSNSLYGGAISLNGAASFTMNGGTITNCGVTGIANKGKSNSAGGGAVRMASTSSGYPTMVMNGGTISGCYAIVGGAVFVTNNYTAGTASVTMNGGTITGCVAGRAKTTIDGWGGAFFLFNKAKASADNTVVTIYGGSITGCKANQYGTLGMNSGVSMAPQNGGKYYILGGVISGNTVGNGGNWDGTPGQWYGQGVHVQGTAPDGSPLLVIGGSAVIDDEIYLCKTGALIEIRDNFSGSAKIYTSAYALSNTDGTGQVIARAGETATEAIAERITVTNGKFGTDGNYVRDEDGNIVPRYCVTVDPDNAEQYILGTPAPSYTVTYTDGVEEAEVFPDQSYTVKEGKATPAFEGTPTRTGYIFNGWNPEVAETVTADATYTAQWTECTHENWSGPVFDEDTLTNIYTCPDCGETRVVNVVARVESTGTYYETLQAALDAAKAIMVDADHDTQTVTLVANVNESVSLTWVKGLKIANNFNLTIDLNGYTVTGNGSSAMVFSASGSGGASYHMNIAINDSVGTGKITGGTGKISGSTTYGGAIHMTGKSGDSLTINGGTITGNTATSGGAIYSSTIGLKVTINGGVITGNSAVGGSGGAISAPTVIMNGGTITGNSVTGTAKFTGRGGGICVWTTTGTLTVTGGQIYGNTAERYGDDIVFASTSTGSTSSPSMKLPDAASMGAGVSGWFVDGYNGAYNSEANTTPRYSNDYAEEFTGYADFSGSAARGKAVALKAAVSAYTVTYEDGVNGQAFENQTYKVFSGTATPAFDGTPARDGYTFVGWTPEVAETVTGDATYTAIWAPAAPERYGSNVTEQLLTIICDSDPDHADLSASWDSIRCKVYPANSAPEWNEELGTWTIGVRIDPLVIFVMKMEKANNNIHHDLVGESHLDTQLKWDAAQELWVPVEPIEVHCECATEPLAPIYKQLKSYQIQVTGTVNGVEKNYYTSIPESAYTVGEVQGNRKDGFTVDITVTIQEGDLFISNWISKYAPGEDYSYNWDKTPHTVTFTLYYNGDLNGTLYGNRHASNTNYDWVLKNGQHIGTVGKAYVGLTRTVTYTDGVDGTEVFPDQVYSVAEGDTTPAFAGTPARDGYVFAGWSPEVTETVTENATYTALWTPAAPDWLGRNVTDDFVKFVCDTDPDHHADVVVKWVANYTKAISDPAWNEELGTWTADVRLDAIDTMYLWMNYEKKIGVDHDLVDGKPIPAGEDSLVITMKWDAEQELWVHMDGKPVELHVSCKTMPSLPTTISGYQVKMVDSTGAAINWFVNVKADSYRFGEIVGSREEGFTVDVTFTFDGNDPYLASWTANRGEGYTYDRTQTPEEITVTLVYAGSLTGTLSSGPWQYNGMTNKGTIATVYVTNAYVVSLDANGGTVDPETIAVTYGKALGELPEPTREGYTFTGWVDENGVSVTADTVYSVAGNATYQASWSANSYKVFFDSNGGNYMVGKYLEAVYGQKYGPLYEAGEVAGLRSEGWYLMDEDNHVTDAEITADTLVATAREHILFQKRSIIEPTVNMTYDRLTSTWSFRYDGKPVTMTANTEKYDGLTYSYQWYKDGEAIEGATGESLTVDGNVSDSGVYKVVVTVKLPNGSTIVTTNSSASGSAEKTLTIQKAKNGVTVMVNDGTNAVYLVVATTNDTYTLKLKSAILGGAPKWEGHTLTGYWNTEPDGSGSSYAVGDVYTFDTHDGNGGDHVILYMQWEYTKYPVTVNPENGEEPYEITVTYEGTLGDYLPENPTREGYTFGGWVDQDGNPIDPDASYTEGSVTEISALWVLNGYTVTLDPNGGTVSPKTLTISYGEAVGELPTPTKEGYTFTGWVDEEGNKVDENTVVTGDMNLTAVWKINEYTITINDGTNETTKTVEHGKAIGELPTPTKEGYTFTGWVDEKGNKVDEKTIVTGDMQLVAQWSVKTTDIPKTGDSTPLMGLALAMLASVAGIAVILRKKEFLG